MVVRTRQFPIRIRRRSRGMILAAVMFATACAAGVGGDRQDLAASETTTGSYLAASHALKVHDDARAADYLLAALKISPDDPLMMSQAVEALIRAGRVAEAIPLARRYLDSGQNSVMARMTVAVGDVAEGSFASAFEYVSDSPEEGNITYITPIMAAWALAGAGRIDDALAHLEPLYSSGAATLYRLHAAWISDLAGRETQANEHLSTVFEAQGQPWLRLTELAAGAYARAAEREKALTLYRSYLAQHPRSKLLGQALERMEAGEIPQRDITSAVDGMAEALFDGVGIARRQNRREAALSLGQLGLFLRPDFPALQMVVAGVIEEFGNYTEANRVYGTVDLSSPLAHSAQLSIARNLDRMDRFEEAADVLRRLADRYPDDPEPLVELGDLMRKHERFGDAVEIYDEAFERIGTPEPHHWRLLYARGIALERDKQWTRAEADFLKALEFEPEQPFVLNYLGYSWVEQGRNYADAERMIRKAVELRPNDGYIVDSLGWVLYRLGRYEEAVGYLERSVELRPEDPVINDHLGDAYWAVGRHREALYQWRAALSLSPEADLQAEIETKLRSGHPIREANAKP